MNISESAWYKVWRILYPLLIYFLLDVLIVWAVEALLSVPGAIEPGSFWAVNTPSIATCIFLAVSAFVCFNIYRRDHVSWSVWIYKRPWYFAVCFAAGALMSHGLSLLVSAIGIDNILGNYSDAFDSVVMAHPAIVILYTAVLAPVSEELLFRAIIFNRLREYIKGFWLPALISSLIFGVYHFNLAQGVFAFFFGIMICAVYKEFHNLWAAIAVHIGGNLISLVLFYSGFGYPSQAVYYISMASCIAVPILIYILFIRSKDSIINDY